MTNTNDNDFHKNNDTSVLDRIEGFDRLRDSDRQHLTRVWRTCGAPETFDEDLGRFAALTRALLNAYQLPVAVTVTNPRPDVAAAWLVAPYRVGLKGCVEGLILSVDGRLYRLDCPDGDDPVFERWHDAIVPVSPDDPSACEAWAHRVLDQLPADWRNGHHPVTIRAPAACYESAGSARPGDTSGPGHDLRPADRYVRDYHDLHGGWFQVETLMTGLIDPLVQAENWMDSRFRSSILFAIEERPSSVETAYAYFVRHLDKDVRLAMIDTPYWVGDMYRVGLYNWFAGFDVPGVSREFAQRAVRESLQQWPILAHIVWPSDSRLQMAPEAAGARLRISQGESPRQLVAEKLTQAPGAPLGPKQTGREAALRGLSGSRIPGWLSTREWRALAVGLSWLSAGTRVTDTDTFTEVVLIGRVIQALYDHDVPHAEKWAKLLSRRLHGNVGALLGSRQSRALRIDPVIMVSLLGGLPDYISWLNGLLQALAHNGQLKDPIDQIWQGVCDAGAGAIFMASFEWHMSYNRVQQECVARFAPGGLASQAQSWDRLFVMTPEVRGYRLVELTSPAELKEEGSDALMKNCVGNGNYAVQARADRVRLLSLRKGDARIATIAVKVSRDGQIINFETEGRGSQPLDFEHERVVSELFNHINAEPRLWVAASVRQRMRDSRGPVAAVDLDEGAIWFSMPVAIAEDTLAPYLPTRLRLQEATENGIST